MGIFSGITDAIGGVFEAVGGVADAVSGIAKAVMDSPFGSILSMLFPGAGAAVSAAGMFSGLLGNVAGAVGGEEGY